MFFLRINLLECLCAALLIECACVCVKNARGLKLDIDKLAKVMVPHSLVLDTYDHISAFMSRRIVMTAS